MSLPNGVLLDTSVIIDLPHLDLGDLATTPAAVSAVSIGELGCGLDIDDPIERAARTERYYTMLDQFEVLPFDLASAKRYAVLATLVRRAGRDPRPRRMDLRIAATAGVHGLPLLTRNAKDFVGLERALDVISI
ncbi:MAG TPA: type II toxin-antitoxin system VapC family toxin [Actinophytocola sp.]|nr:type II toxin-antitoxin system VapC family toxin [Actinophytocola sp.]